MPGAATIYVKHLEPMAAFYAGCFGLARVAEAGGDYVVLEADGWTISLVQVPPPVAEAIVLSEPAVRRTGTPIKLTFDVPSLGCARTTVTAMGGDVDQSEWEFRGHRHCDFADPEGNVGQLRAPL